MIAVVKVRPQPWYRREAFELGLQRVGYALVARGTPSSRDDLMITWNRKPGDETESSEWERLGGTVLVTENGYIGKDEQGRQLYAISAHQHNGAGWFPVGSEDRFTPLGVDVMPWRSADSKGHVLITAQRGIGSKTMASPTNWHAQAHKYLGERTKREIRIRPHPGNQPPSRPLESDLENAWACAIWSSSSGVRALTLGIPVLRDAPHWICEEAAMPLAYVETPRCDDDKRASAFHRMAHGQWRVAEIEAGEPFARIRDGLWQAKWAQ